MHHLAYPCDCGRCTNGRRRRRAAQNSDTKIVNGVDAIEHSICWQVYFKISVRQSTTINCSKFQVHLIIYFDGGYGGCGGSIIDDAYILTAAHCTDGATGIEVRVSEHSVGSGSDHITYSAMSAFANPDYNPSTYDNDHSIIVLASPIDMTQAGVGPVCLPLVGQTWTNGDLTTVSGWGTLDYGGSTPDILQTVDISFVDSATCGSDYEYSQSQITDNMFCAYDQGAGTDACQGDSGGPLTIINPTTGRAEQAGIVSWGISCGANGYPGVYADVTKCLWMLPVLTDYFGNAGDCLNGFQQLCDLYTSYKDCNKIQNQATKIFTKIFFALCPFA